MQRKLISSILATVMVFTTLMSNVSTVLATDNSTNTAQTLTSNANADVNISDISISPGKDSTEINFAWYSVKSDGDSQVHIAKKSDYDGTTFPEDKAVKFTGNKQTGNNNFISNKVTVTGISDATDYVYRVGDGVNWSEVNSYTSQNSKAYNFLVAGDPQIGASGNIDSDKNGWVDTMNKATATFPNSSFLLSVGDQVNNGGEVTGGNNETEYSAFFTPNQLKNLPIAAIAGNHETYGAGHNTHFNLPNESTYGTVSSAPTSGGDYYFTYGNTLFMMLNSNDVNSTDHQVFMKDAIAKNPNAKWKVVSLHHSIYSSADHATDDDILARRNTLPQIFTDLDIDVVLDGHDHCYTRTYQMVGNVPTAQANDKKVTVTNPSGTTYQNETVVNPTGVAYITANSSSGSKYYEMQQANSPSYYEAVKQQIHVPTFSDVEVNDNSITITTYRTDNMEKTDSYTIAKGDVEDNPAPAISDITLAPGSDATQMNFTWYTDMNSRDTEVQVAKKSDYTEGNFPTDKAKTFVGKKSQGNNNALSNKVTVKGLDQNTKYAYRVGNGTSWSTVYDFSTQNTSDYSFLLAGDPQIGASGNIENDKNGWMDTVKKATDKFPSSSFLLSLGDQVNNGGEVTGGNNEPEYSAYFAPEQLRNLPVTAFAGNHETSGKGHNTHFNVPNESTYGTVSSSPATGGDYYFTYGSTLYMVLNSNDTNTADHKAFMQDAIAKNPNATWKVVALHHSIYSSANHSTDSDIISRRNTMPQVYTELGIDVVLDGHDHCYTRTYQMVNNEAVAQTNDDKKTIQNPSGATYQDETVTDPSGVLYITANSASGSKYYEFKTPNSASYYEAVKQQIHVPTFSDIDVTGNSITITTYRTDNMEVTDKYTIEKTKTKDVQVSNEDSSKVTDAITNSADNSNITVDVSSNKLVKKEIFDTLKGKNKTINFIQNGLQWMFNGNDITESTKDIDMTVNVSALKNTTSANKAAILAKAGNAGVTVVSFANNGVLPGKATIKAKLDSEWLSDPINANKSLFVYYYNETNKKLELITSGLKSTDGYVQFDITHNSDYIISDTDLSEPTEMSISDAKANPSGKAILTGVVSYVVGSNVFMQDDKAGVCFYNSAKASVKVGDQIKVTGALSNYHGLIEITPKAYSDVNVISSNNTVNPKLLTIGELNDSVQSMLIQLKGVTLKDINTSAASTIEDATGSVVIYKMPELTGIVAGDKIDVTASLIKYGTTLELTVASASDITKAGQAEANAVIEKINAIPDKVTLDDKEKVVDARNAYNALTDAQKALVTNLSKLTAAEQIVAKLEADKKAADTVVAQIDAIPSKVTLDDKAKIAEARAAYEALTDDQKALVTNLAKLIAAEETIAKLEPDKKAADEVIAKIDAIPAKLTLGDKAKVTGARAAYEALTDSQKAMVTNLSKLTAAEETISKLEASQKAVDAVIAKINAIPINLTLLDKAKVTEARAAYNALTDTQKSMVTNLAKLTSAEKVLASLEVDKKAADAVIAKIDEISSKVTLADKVKVDDARKAYNALTASQKAMVSNISKLRDAEEVISRLEEDKVAADSVVSKINTLPSKITLSDKIKVEAARKAYDSLTSSQKSMVTNLAKLKLAEETIAKLENGTTPTNPSNPTNPAEPGNPTSPSKVDNKDSAAVVAAINDAIKKNTNLPVVDVTTSTIVSKDVFNAIKGQDKVITFEGKNIIWTFNGRNIKSAVTADIDLSLKPVSDALKDKESAKVKSITGKEVSIAAFSFSHDGELPGIANVRVFVGKEWANKIVNVYRYYSDKDSYEVVSSNVKVDAEGYVTYTTNHCSDYFITDASIKLPQTGSMIDSEILMILGLILVCSGILFVRKKKNKIAE